jgi:DNA-binding response OmpR family regulator
VGYCCCRNLFSTTSPVNLVSNSQSEKAISDQLAVRVLVVDDFARWRDFVLEKLRENHNLRVIGVASDGLEAIQKAEELQPDLILLDIGLPSLNGIEVARQIRELSPKSKILFLSQESSTDVVQGALSTGAHGYVLKSEAGRELLDGVNAVLRGEQFVSGRFSGHDFIGASYAAASHSVRSNAVVGPFQHDTKIASHEVGFHSDDRRFLDNLTQFIGAALRAGNTAIVLSTESHRDSLLARLQTCGLDVGAAIEQGRYIALNAADALPTFMLNGMPDPVRFMKVLGDLVATAAKAGKGEQVRVAIFGEMCDLLWAQGNGEAAIQVEKLGNLLVKRYDVDILCSYMMKSFQREPEHHIYKRICAEHSAVCSQWSGF